MAVLQKQFATAFFQNVALIASLANSLDISC